MRKRVIWKAAFALACAAGLLLGQQAAPQQATPQQTTPPQETTPIAKQPQVKSQAEGQAVMAIFQAQDPDSRIKAADELVTKFADSEFKPLALFFAAVSYQQKNDYENTIVYAERTIEADPKHYQSMLILASTIAQRTREFDLDREEKLGRAEKYAKDALEILKTVPKPRADLPDEQWEAAKKDFQAQAYEAFGLAEMARKDYTGAAAQFKKALDVATNPDPATKVRLGAAYEKAGQHDNAIAVLDEVINDPTVHAQIKQFAQAERARAMEAKSGGQKAETPAAPAQVEIKKQQ